MITKDSALLKSRNVYTEFDLFNAELLYSIALCEAVYINHTVE